MILKHARILVVDDEPDVLFALKLLLKSEVREVVTEKNPELLLSLLRHQRFDVVLLDMNYRSGQATGNEGFYWLGRIREHDPTTAVILITAYGRRHRLPAQALAQRTAAANAGRRPPT
jgi:two-component system response regulator HydG